MLIRWRIGNGSLATSWPATNAWPDVGSSNVARILLHRVVRAPHVGQLRDLLLVVFEVVREFVRIELCELDRDSLDVRRPDITQRFTPRQFEEALQRVCAK